MSDRFKIGGMYPVLLKNKQIGIGEIITKKYLKLNQINGFIARLDTGYDAKKCKELLKTMYENFHIDWNTQELVLYLVKLERQKSIEL